MAQQARPNWKQPQRVAARPVEQPGNRLQAPEAVSDYSHFSTPFRTAYRRPSRRVRMKTTTAITPGSPRSSATTGPREEEDRLHVEQHEQQAEDVVADERLVPALADCVHAALVGADLLPGGIGGPHQVGDPQGEGHQQDSECGEGCHRDVVLEVFAHGRSTRRLVRPNCGCSSPVPPHLYRSARTLASIGANRRSLELADGGPPGCDGSTPDARPTIDSGLRRPLGGTASMPAAAMSTAATPAMVSGRSRAGTP